MTIGNEFVKEAQQLNFKEFDLLDQVSLKEVVKNSEVREGAKERHSHTQE